MLLLFILCPLKIIIALSSQYPKGLLLGVNLKELVPKTAIRLEDLSGRSIAIDAYNALYQFLAIIRQP
ncbi:MAG: hypothetical protein ACFE7R_11365, partial [Candidatus Hodarchaeota archaeon]